MVSPQAPSPQHCLVPEGGSGHQALGTGMSRQVAQPWAVPCTCVVRVLWEPHPAPAVGVPLHCLLRWALGKAKQAPALAGG